MSTIWTHELLDALRQIGDPLLDSNKGRPAGWRKVKTAEPHEAFVGSEEVRLLQTWRRSELGALPPTVDPDDKYWTADPPAADDEQLAAAQELFVLHGGEIAAALLMASLPHAYAARTGAEVLAFTGELQSNARRRIAETAQLTVDVLFPDESELYAVDPPVAPTPGRSLRPGGHGYVRVLSTRLTHAVIRDLIRTSEQPWDPQEDASVPRHEGVKRGVPINQEDLLGTLGTFTITVIEVLDKLGISWTEPAQQAYIDLWDRVGALLGIGTAEVTKRLASEHGIEVPDEYEGQLRPKTTAELRALVDLIIERSWPLPLPQFQLGPFDAGYSKVLVRALLDELQTAMPRGMERMPLMVMRYLVREEAQELLGLGAGGLLDALVQIPRTPHPLRIQTRGMGQMMVEASMRMAANEVSRRAFVHFIRTRADDPSAADFWFPAVPADFVRMPTGRQLI